MRKRPLCMVCLTFLLIRSCLLMLTSGETLVKVPAYSIFSDQSEKTEVIIQGQVYKKTNTSKTQILYLKNNSMIHKNKSYYESNILIYDDTFLEIPIGKIICVKGKTVPFEKPRNPGNFDQQLYYAKQNIYGYVWSEKIISVSGAENKLMESLHKVKKAWSQSILENMSEENGQVLCAMLLGEKSDVDADMKEQYQKAGISHVLAISGLHISFIGLGIYKLIRRSGVSYIGSGILASLVLSIYVLMIGFSVSIVRAYVMLLFRIGADMAGRVYDIVTALMVSAALLAMYQPLYLADAAFYLSHGAILGILILLPCLTKMLPQKRWLEGSLAGLAIHIALFPVLLWFYFEIPTYSMLINMVVIPLMTWVLSLGMFGVLFSLLWLPVGKVLFGGCDWILSFFSWVSEKCCRLPFSRVVFGKPNWWEVVIYYVILLSFVFLLKKCKGKPNVAKFRKAGLLLAIFMVLIFVKVPNGKLQITMLDVGQGDSIFMKGPRGHTYLVDGGSSDVDELAKYRIEPFLKSQGVGGLDYVFVSHGDLDHYSGIKEMLERQLTGVRIKQLVLPTNYKEDKALLELVKLAMQKNVGVAVIKANQELKEGDLEITCLQPDEGRKALGGNAGSMVLDVTFREFDMLLTGDVEGKGEEQLVGHLPKKTYDILKVAHHGSKYSTSERFLKFARPKIAWISAGKQNSYGHPHGETLTRLEKIQSEVFQTTKYGAIMVETDGDLIDIFPSSL